MNRTDISTHHLLEEGGTLDFLFGGGAPPAITKCFHATISTPSGRLWRSTTQNLCASTYFTAHQSDVAYIYFFFDVCISVVTTRPTMLIVTHRNPARPTATCSYIFRPSLAQIFFFPSSAAIFQMRSYIYIVRTSMVTGSGYIIFNAVTSTCGRQWSPAPTL